MAKRRKNLGYAAEWRKDRGCWYYRVQVKQRRVRGKLEGLTDRKRDERAAWARAAQIHVDLQRQARRPEPGTLTLRQLLEHDVQRPGIRPATREFEVSKARRLLEHWGEDKVVEEIGTGELSAYAAVRSAVVSGASVNKEVGVLVAAWNRAHEDGMLSQRAPKYRKLPTVKYRPEILTSEQVEQLIEAAHAYDAAHPPRYGNAGLAEIVEFLYHTGLRRSELGRIEWKHVDWKKREVVVFTAKRGSAVEYRERVMPLNDRSVDVLNRRRAARREGQTHVFGKWGETQARRTSGLWYRRLKAAVRDAGLSERINLHSLRHTFATIMLDSDLSHADVAELVGHTSPATTISIYAHARPGRAKRAVEALAGQSQTKGKKRR